MQSVPAKKFIGQFNGYDLTRFQWITDLFHRLKISPCKVLDFGSFDGSFLAFFNKNGFDSFGLEPQEEMVDFCNKQNLKVLLGSIPHEIPNELSNQKFGLITSFESIYYWSDLHQCAAQIESLLEVNGLFLIKFNQGTSNYYQKSKDFSKRVGAFQSFVNMKALKILFEKHNLKLVHHQVFAPIWQNSIEHQKKSLLFRIVISLKYKIKRRLISKFASPLKWDKIILVFKKTDSN